MRELMGRELAKQYPAGLVKLRDGGRIFGRDEFSQILEWLVVRVPAVA